MLRTGLLALLRTERSDATRNGLCAFEVAVRWKDLDSTADSVEVAAPQRIREAILKERGRRVEKTASS